MATPNKKPKPVMDVSHPGQSRPDATARPVIIGHKPRFRDPMMAKPKEAEEDKGESVTVNVSTKPAEDSTEESAEDTASTPILVTKKKISPISEEESTNDDDGKLKTPDLAAVATGQAEESAETEATETTSEPKTEDTKEEASTEDEATDTEKTSTESDSAATLSAVVDQVNGNDKPQEPDSNDSGEKHEEVTKLIEDKKYFLPIGTRSRHKKKVVGVVMALLLMLFSGTYVAADMGAFGEIDLPVSFINTNEIQDPVFTVATEDVNAESGETDKQSAEKEGWKPPSGYLPYEVKELGFKFAYPADWDVNIPVKQVAVSGDNFAKIESGYIQAPSGNRITVIYEPFSTGGDGCEPLANDEPFKAGNACSSKEVLKEEKLPLLPQNESQDALLATRTIFITDTKFSDNQGNLIYTICFDNYTDQQLAEKPAVNDPVMGAVMPCHAFKSGLDIRYTLESEEEFTSKEADTVRKIMRTFTTIE